MINQRIIEKIEPTDIEEFLKDCQQKASELGVSVEYYVEEYVIFDE